MLTLKENNEFKKAQMLLEEVTFDDLRNISNVFKQIESITNQYNLPEIERVIEIARNDLATISTQNKKTGLAGVGDKILNIFGLSKAERGARKILGRLVAIQATLVKFIRILPDIMTLSSKNINVQSEGKIVEATAMDLARELNVQYQEIQTRANTLAGKKFVKNANDEIPEEIEVGLRQALQKPNQPQNQQKSVGKDTTSGQPQNQDEQPLSKLMGKASSQRFIDYVEKALKTNKAFIGKETDIANFPNPTKIAVDLLKMPFNEFKAFVEQSKSVRDTQVGISQQGAKQVVGALKKDGQQSGSVGTSGNKVSTTDLYKAWREMFPGVKRATLQKMVVGLNGKTIVAGKGQSQQKTKV